MTTRVHSDLRRLALAYYRGWIPREKYLSIRKDYLQAITNDEVPVSIDPKKIAPPPRKTSSTKTRQTKPGISWVLVITLIVALVLVALLGYIFTASDEPATKPVATETPVNNTITTPSAPAAQETQTDEERFIAYLQDNFVSQGAWNHDTLNSLKLKWLGLSQEQQSVVRENSVFGDFTRLLIERIVDERSLNNIVPSDYELALMTMAKNIGVINQIPE